MTEEEFYDKVPEWIKADISKWTHITLLAYFCHKYEQKHKVRFRLVRAKKGPTMTKEAADFAKLFRTLAPENYSSLKGEAKSDVRQKVNLKIKNYINFMFDYKFRSGERSINGTRLFLAPAMINEFERMYTAYLQRTKVESKLSKLISWCQKENEEIFGLHQLERKEDLKMIQRYVDMYNLGENAPEVRTLSKAKEIGLI